MEGDVSVATENSEMHRKLQFSVFNMDDADDIDNNHIEYSNEESRHIEGHEKDHDNDNDIVKEIDSLDMMMGRQTFGIGIHDDEFVVGSNDHENDILTPCGDDSEQDINPFEMVNVNENEEINSINSDDVDVLTAGFLQ